MRRLPSVHVAASMLACNAAQGLRYLAFAGLLVAGSIAHAQQPAPPGMDPKTAAARRFPQPVRVGSLIGRLVLRPIESQDVIGKVARVVRGEDGSIHVVIDYGGLLGFGARPIAVPVEAMVILGDVMEVVDLTPAQLDALPTFAGEDTTPISADQTIKVGLARPSH